MKKRTMPIVIATAILFASASQTLAQTDGGFQIGVSAGALSGASVHLGYRFSSETSYLGNRFGVRLEYSTLSPLKSFIEDQELEIEEQKFDIFAKGNQFGALLDFYPFGGTWGLGNFRISGGYYTGKFELGAKTSKNFAGDNFEFNGKTYEVTGSASLSAALKSKATGPYLGVGFDIALLYGLKFFADAGVVFTDEPTINTDVFGTASIECTDSTGTTCGTFTLSDPSAIAKVEEFMQDMQSQFDEELKQIKKPYYPMAKVGLLYRF